MRPNKSIVHEKVVHLKNSILNVWKGVYLTLVHIKSKISYFDGLIIIDVYLITQLLSTTNK